MSGIYDATPCQLGEGPLWHPERQALFWFDIVNARLYCRENDETRHWQFDHMVSAAGWVDKSTLIIASERALFQFDVETGESEELCPLEADNSTTRSNDGRADPMGGFWIGTMSKQGEKKAGAIYRYYRGVLRKLVPGISVTNAICFAPDGRLGYYADTQAQTVWKQPLDAEGWPMGDAEMFLDLTQEGLSPDGAVTDAEGNFWNAQWGAARVAVYTPEGSFLRAIPFDAPHSSCPAFIGEALDTLICTSARQGLTPEKLAGHPLSGATFVAHSVGKGLPEPRVLL